MAPGVGYMITHALEPSMPPNTTTAATTAPSAPAHIPFYEDAVGLSIVIIVAVVFSRFIPTTVFSQLTAMALSAWAVWLGKEPPKSEKAPTVKDCALLPGSEISFMTILSSGMSVGFLFIDDHHIIRVFNPAAEDIFGYHQQEVIGSNLSVLIPGDEAARHHFYVKNYRDNRDAQRVSRAVGKTRALPIRKSDGTVELVMVSVTDVNNGIKGFVGLFWRQDVHPVQHVSVVPVTPRSKTPIKGDVS